MKTKSSTIDWKALKKAASLAQRKAHAPYSSYPVGAALLAVDGTVFIGTNVENASYPLSLCAERSAISAAVAAGKKKFLAIAIVSNGPKAAPPCGGCRQVLAEFGPSFPVKSFATTGDELTSSVKELLPAAFGADFFK
ncbi:MAG: cytidine deaminase [Sandaracinaceae bacterium]|nr:cytidine deaminase [Sandaracinaceae bacterium]